MFGMKKKAKENEKLEASQAFVMVDGERVSLKTLLNAKQEAPEAVEIAADETIVMNGKEIAVADLVESYKNSKKKDNVEQDMVENADEDDEEKENGEKEEKENTSIITPQKIKKTKADAKKKKDDDKEEAEEETKEHSKDEEKENDDDEEKPMKEKKNSVSEDGHFTRLNTARHENSENGVDDGFGDSLAGKVARGNKRYSSAKK